MTVRIAKQPINLRERLSELERPIGLKGSELMRAETAQEARDLVSAGRRNLVINGDMRIDQRNAGASVSLSSGTSIYICDRFLFEQGAVSNASTAQRVTDSPDGFFHSLKFTRGAASFSSLGWSAFNQRIEGLLLSQLAWGTPSAKPITLSFWVKSTTPGTYSLNITHYDGSNERWNVQEYNINSANTWEKKTLTFIGDSSYGFGSGGTSGWMRLYWHIGGDSGSAAATSFNTWVAGAGGIRASTNQVNLYNISGATWQITGVQLEVGKNATEFEHRSYGEELALCQRYYQKYNLHYFVVTAYSTTKLIGNVYFPVEMRSHPTASLSGGTIDRIGLAGSSNITTTLTLNSYYGQDGKFSELRFNSTTNLTDGLPYIIYPSVYSYAEFSSEL